MLTVTTTRVPSSVKEAMDALVKLKTLLPQLEAENNELRQRVERLEISNAKLNEDMTNLYEALASGRIS